MDEGCQGNAEPRQAWVEVALDGGGDEDSRHGEHALSHCDEDSEILVCKQSRSFALHIKQCMQEVSVCTFLWFLSHTRIP